MKCSRDLSNQEINQDFSQPVGVPQLDKEEGNLEP
jgi:hypothetical protein